MQEILLGEDLDDLLETSESLEEVLAGLGDEQVTELIDKVFAFMDAHPIDLADLSSNPEEVEVR